MKAVYGQHFPQGKAAFDYIIGVDGTLGKVDGLQYTLNYYENCATQTHPFDKRGLVNSTEWTKVTFDVILNTSGYINFNVSQNVELKVIRVKQ